MGYWDFFSGSCWAPEEAAPLLGVELLPLAPLVPDGLELAPPEAEPDAAPDFDGSVALGELDDGALDELPPEGDVAEDEELEPDGGVDGVALLLELPLVLPLLPVVLPVPLSWPQAARPNARATAAASIESFMCPPWLGIRKNAARNGPGPRP